MKNLSVFCLFCLSISTLGLHAFAQNSQWPSNFPYPPEFPPSGENVTVVGAGDESGALIATYTDYSTGNTIGGTFTVTNKLIYEYQEFTSSSGILVRRKLRSTWDNFPQLPSLRQTTRTGFTEFRNSQTTANGSLESISTTYHNWDNNPTPGGPIANQNNTRFASRILSNTPNSSSVDYESHCTRTYNSRFQFLFPRDETIKVTFVGVDHKSGRGENSSI